MPEVADIGDGSQDALLVRLAAGGDIGWGECEASPLPSLAGWVAPMSHSACKPVRDSVVGQQLDGVEDIDRIGNLVRQQSMDLLQADHILSGVDIAMWDLLGHRLDAPVWRLLGYERSHPKVPYASMLFGEGPSETLAKTRRARGQGFRAAKLGWGPFGRGSVQDDAAQLAAARQGLGDGATLLVDAGTVWGEDVAAASARLEALEASAVTWLEEPFAAGALSAYRELADRCDRLALAGGEGSHTYHMARHAIDYAGIGYVQIDAGRIGGISVAKRVADYATTRDVRYVNHTFTSHLALSASLQPYAGSTADELCEYPVELSELARAITGNHIETDSDGRIAAPVSPCLGIEVDEEALRRYLVDVEIRVAGSLLYRSPR